MSGLPESFWLELQARPVNPVAARCEQEERLKLIPLVSGG